MHISLTRTIGFRATHRYHRAEWSVEKNRERFGAAGEGHAHDYRCAVTVTGPLDADTEMVMDLAVLDGLLAEEVNARYAGKRLDEDLPEFSKGRILPTCEALAAQIWLRLDSRLPAGVRLERVRIAEDADLHADCTGVA
ncbi:MAG: 6-carboxytetrahydropterin synthase [Gemmatimonadales bacterium]